MPSSGADALNLHESMWPTGTRVATDLRAHAKHRQVDPQDSALLRRAVPEERRAELDQPHSPQIPSPRIEARA